jgi:hypothetical protein
MSDCQIWAALSLIAYDAGLTAPDMAQLARQAMEGASCCGRRSHQEATINPDKIAMIEPNYDPDDPDNPMLDILMPKLRKTKDK